MINPGLEKSLQMKKTFFIGQTVFKLRHYEKEQCVATENSRISCVLRYNSRKMP